MPPRIAETITQELPFVYDVGDPEIDVKGREDMVQSLIETLYRKRMQNCVLVGPPGVGKTALVKEVARRLRGTYKFVSVDINALESGTDLRGSFEDRMLHLAAAVRRHENNYREKIVLFIDEIHTICTAGAIRAKETELTAANILKPYISDGRLRVWGATTVSEYASTIGRDKALMRRLPPIYVEEIPMEQIIEVLKSFSHEEKVPDTVIRLAYELSLKIPGTNPDKSIDIVDRAISKKRLYGDKISWEEAVKKSYSEVSMSMEAMKKILLQKE